MRKLILLFAAFLLLAFHAQSQIIYVDINVVGGANNGTSWANAYSDLQNALTDALGTPGADSIYVAEGIYTPSLPGGRDSTFRIFAQTMLYGGFSPSNGAIDLTTRDFKLYETTLSGDRGLNGMTFDDAYTVVTTRGVGSQTGADGFTIRDGRSTGSGGGARSGGGGWFNETFGGNASFPIIRNCSFIDNYVNNQGGAIHSDSGGTFAAGLTITSCFFINNSSGFQGGAIHAESNGQDHTVLIENSLFYNNMTRNAGARGGVINCYTLNNGQNQITIRSSSLSGNSADGPGDVISFIRGTMATGLLDVTITNSILWGNDDGDGNNDVIENSPFINQILSYSLINGIDNTANFGLDGTLPASDPLFTNSAIGDLTLQGGSPVIDIGSNALVTTAEDLDGNIRIQDGDGNASAIVDFGAYEFVLSCIDPDVPTLTFSPATPCPGDNVMLTITGNLNSATAWQVYTGSCGGTLIGSTASNTFVVNPLVNTTYFIRGEGGCVTPSACQSILVSVDDVTPPTITCPATQTETANASCMFTLPDYTGLATAVDNCGVPSVTQSPVIGTVVGTGITTITLTASDGTNMNTSTFDVNVQGGATLTVTCPGNQIENFDASCMFTLPDYISLVSTTPGCSGAATVTQSPTTGTAVSGLTTITMVAMEPNGNSVSCTFDVIPNDVNPPTITCPTNQTAIADGNCMFILQDYTGLATASDNCGVPLVTQSPVVGSSVGIGVTTITLTASDGVNMTSCTFDVTVSDTTPPTITCPTTQTETANASCMFTLPDYTGLATAVDNCGVPSVTQSPVIGTVVGTGITTITLTASDGTNTNSCTFDVDVQGGVGSLTIVCPGNQNETFDTSCMFTLPDYTSLVTTTPGCSGAATVTQSPTTGTAVSGLTTITMVAMEPNGNSVSCTFDVIVTDGTAPIAMCVADFTLALDAAGMASISVVDIDNGSTDNCGITMSSIDVSNFDCSNLGQNTATLTVTDAAGNSDTCTAVVTIVDTTPPMAACSDFTAQLDAAGSVTIFPANVDGGSTDACGIVTYSLDIDTFDCSNIGSNTVMLTVTDGSGNNSNCSAIVTVEDTLLPNVICQNITIQLDGAGMASIVPADIDGGSNDNCGVASLNVDISTFNCSNVGPNNVSLIVEDVNGNFNSCIAIVTVEDLISPVAVCQDITIQLDALGMASIIPTDVEGGSTDNCGIAGFGIDVTDFDCSDLGPNDVTLTVIDVNGNTSSCVAVVTVENANGLQAVCQDITVQLDAAGMATIIASDIDGGSLNYCPGISPLTIDIDTFDCSNVGANNVILTVTDNAGNTDNCAAVVTVEDMVAPSVSCVDITIQLDVMGMASIIPADIDGGSTDACGIASISVDIDTFDCSNVGLNDVTLTVTDVNGNIGFCVAVVTVEDLEIPVAICQDFTVQLDAAGMITVLPSQVDGGSTDNCGIASAVLDMDTFNCSDVGPNDVLLTVMDTSGNTSSCMAVITVEDSVAPDAVCIDITIQLDSNGMATIMPSDIDGGSTDACGVSSLAIDISSFDCSNVGLNNVTLSVQDVNGNSSSCVAVVTVEEENAIPLAVCQNLTVPLQQDGTATITPQNVNAGSSGAGCFNGMTLDIDTFDCSDIGSPEMVIRQHVLL